MRARTFALLAATLALAAEGCGRPAGDATSTSDPAGVAIHHAPMRVGVRSRRTNENVLAIEARGLGGTRATLIAGQGDEVRVEEVLAVTAGEATKIRMTYERSTSIVLAPEDQKGVYASAVDKKSYVVERAGKELRVAGADLETPPKPELETVSRDYSALGHRSEVAAAIPSGALHRGDAVPELAAAIRGRLEQRDTAKIETLEAKVGETRVVDGARCIVFEITGRMKLDVFARILFDLRGEYVVRIGDGWESSFTVDGIPASDVATREGDGAKIALDKKLTKFRFVYTASYSQ